MGVYKNLGLFFLRTTGKWGKRVITSRLPGRSAGSLPKPLQNTYASCWFAYRRLLETRLRLSVDVLHQSLEEARSSLVSF